MKIKEGLQTTYDNYVAINSEDAYGKAVVAYGERWGNLMEEWLAAGVELEDIWKRTSHEADTEGITGFMYGAAVAALAHFWVHGEALRKLHNASFGGAPEAQGTVNPAIITIGPKED